MGQVLDKIQGKEWRRRQIRKITDKVYDHFKNDSGSAHLTFADLYIAVLLVYNDINKCLPGPHFDPPSKEDVRTMIKIQTKTDGREPRSETIAIRSETISSERETIAIDREGEREGERERELCEGKGERELVEVEGAGSSKSKSKSKGLIVEVEWALDRRSKSWGSGSSPCPGL